MSDDLSKVDWGKPIEAYHEDGTTVGMTFHKPIYDDGVWVYKTFDSPSGKSNENWREDGSDFCAGSGWRIRNVAELSDTSGQLPPDDIAKRMEALVREMAGAGDIRAMTDEARAIVALLPEPVDADLVEARRLAVSFRSGEKIRDEILTCERDAEEAIQALLAAIKHGRALERDSREG